MATLVRDRDTDDDDRDDRLLRENIPAPFPSQSFVDTILVDLAAEPVDYDTTPVVHRIQTALAAVNHSCIMTLASVLAPLTNIDDPNSPAIPLDQVLTESPLACLVHALRARNPYVHLSSEDILLSQLHQLVDAIGPSLGSADAHLAQAIVSLLLDLDQLPASLALAAPLLASQPVPFQGDVDDSIASLQRHLTSLQPSLASTSSASRPTPPESVRIALLWARIDDQLDTVASLSRARTASPPFNQDLDDALPPDYDAEFHHFPFDRPPSYVADGYLDTSFDQKQLYPPEKVSPVASSSTETSTEPDHSASSAPLDLDNITHAIERLYDSTPQLENQRVELRREKVLQMETAKQAKGKARILQDTPDPELDKMLDLLGRASSREITDQSVIIDPQRTAREKVTVDIEEQRRKYIEHLVHRASVGRLHSQDAFPSLVRSGSSSSIGDTLQETDEDQYSEVQPERSSRDGKRASYPAPPPAFEPPSDRLRNRSLSAPHLAWLRPREKFGSATSSRDNFGPITRSLSSDPKSLSSRSVRSLSGRLRGASKSRSPSTGGEAVNRGALDIAYVAEHHETLRHVLLFIGHVGASGVPLAEVLPSTSSGTHGDCLFLRLGGTPSPPLALPAPVIPGSKTVISRSGHWEIKASCYQSGGTLKENEDVTLLPASELALLSPSSFTCSSCSLPLVPIPPARYRDLPSEHWEELVDAWMCHPEGQTLAKAGGDFGFWPTSDEALVGGSYVLFDAQAVAGGNVKCVGVRERGEHTRLARCLCGAILGRQHDRREEDGSVSRMYRLFKYAIRPVSASSHVPKIPMSAFVLHDMLEHVQAHATYRFVLLDEEEEKPRFLIWLFKPRIRISYMLRTSALLPKSGTVNASKVLYKILGPTSSDLKDTLTRYPGFPQAEYLFYPMDVCRKLAALLKESSASYPESMRTMTGLDVGWLATA